MARISIYNFGPIERIENFEIKQLNAFIGEQASGKTTLAKLIYLFNGVKEDIREARESGKAPVDELIRLIQKRFYLYFGSSKQIGSFKVVYYFDDDKELNKSMALRPGEANSIRITFNSPNPMAEDHPPKGDINHTIWPMLVARDQTELKKLFDSYFTDTTDWTYIPAGRLVRSAIKQHALREYTESKQLPAEQAERINIEFVKQFELVKNKYLAGVPIDEAIDRQVLLYNLSPPKKQYATAIMQAMQRVIKGEYSVGEDGSERIKFDNGKSVIIDYASSGQQEALGIFVILLTSIFKDKPSTVIIEEPEAHLFPMAQKAMIYAVGHFLNADERNKVFITSHSPYIFTSLNTLFFATKTVDKFPDQQESILRILNQDTINLLRSDNANIYQLEGGAIKSIIDDKEGMIDRHKLDGASETILEEFDELLNLW